MSTSQIVNGKDFSDVTSPNFCKYNMVKASIRLDQKVMNAQHVERNLLGVYKLNSFQSVELYMTMRSNKDL